MDSAIDIRKKIHAFIETADEKILQIFNAIILYEEENEPYISESFYEELDKRKAKHLDGKSKSYTLQEVKDRARASLK